MKRQRLATPPAAEPEAETEPARAHTELMAENPIPSHTLLTGLAWE